MVITALFKTNPETYSKIYENRNAYFERLAHRLKEDPLKNQYNYLLREEITDIYIVSLLTQKKHLADFARQLQIQYYPSETFSLITKKVDRWFQNFANYEWQTAILYFAEKGSKIKPTSLAKRIDMVFKDLIPNVSEFARFAYVNQCIDEKIRKRKVKVHTYQYLAIMTKITTHVAKNTLKRSANLIEDKLEQKRKPTRSGSWDVNKYNRSFPFDFDLNKDSYQIRFNTLQYIKYPPIKETPIDERDDVLTFEHYHEALFKYALEFPETCKGLSFGNLKELFSDLHPVINFYYFLIERLKPREFFKGEKDNPLDFPVRYLTTNFSNNLSNFILKEIFYSQDRKSTINTILKIGIELKKSKLYFLLFPIVVALNSVYIEKILAKYKFEEEKSDCIRVDPTLSSLRALFDGSGQYAKFQIHLTQEECPSLIPLSIYYNLVRLEIDSELERANKKNRLMTNLLLQRYFASCFPNMHHILEKSLKFSIKKEKRYYTPLIQLFWVSQTFDCPPLSWSNEAWKDLEESDKLFVLANDYSQSKWQELDNRPLA